MTTRQTAGQWQMLYGGVEMSSNPPTWSRSLIPDSDEEFVDDAYGAGELDRMDYDELRAIAAEHPSDDVHGRMGQDELREKLEGKTRVNVE